MAVLATATIATADITAEAEILRYQHDGDDALALVRLDLGSVAKPITAGDIYIPRIYINSVLISPQSEVAVSTGPVAIFQSRNVIIRNGDMISVCIVGLSGDASVRASAILYDASPLTNDAIANIQGDIIAAVVAAIEDLNISVVNERIILGPCATSLTKMPVQIR